MIARGQEGGNCSPKAFYPSDLDVVRGRRSKKKMAKEGLISSSVVWVDTSKSKMADICDDGLGHKAEGDAKKEPRQSGGGRREKNLKKNHGEMKVRDFANNKPKGKGLSFEIGEKKRKVKGGIRARKSQGRDRNRLKRGILAK